MSTCSLRRAFSKIHITEVMWEPYLFPCMVLRLALQNYVVGCQGLSLSLFSLSHLLARRLLTPQRFSFSHSKLELL